ncbi:MAG: adenosylcobinamide-phosphate synthase CbiB [bacterium]|nr:adenosylcobinamide-phosphate synthase CbiB [bacterium]
MTYFITIQIIFAYILDLIIGDPQWLPHPVVLIGKAIEILEKGITKVITNKKVAGIILVFLVVVGTYFFVFILIGLAARLHVILGIIVSIYFVFVSLSTKDLSIETNRVYTSLNRNNLSLARENLARIVGRDTEGLNEREIIRASVETVAENTVDGIISPVFFAFIGGAPLSMAYKAINTLDSMVGYKNKRYIDLGWASAKLDDIANFIPARISMLLIPIASFISGKGFSDSIRIILRDRKKHASPNSGISEAGFAGALGIRLGGANYYEGKLVGKPCIGDAEKPLELLDIKDSIRIMYACSALSIVFGCCIKLLIK